jgi:hypothetical protein
MRGSWHRILCIGLVAVIAAGCGDDGDDAEVENANGDGTAAPASGDTGEDRETGDGSEAGNGFGEPVEVDGLTVTLEPPRRRVDTFGESLLEVDVTFDNEGSEAAPFADPLLECGGATFEIDHDSANFPAEISGGRSDRGTLSWSDGGACDEGGMVQVGDHSFGFEAPTAD